MFWLTFACLALTGAADTVSMVFRNLIRQLETPDHLRGRMTGVNMIFFMGGPQLGELEAGLVANWLGPVVSVVTGGVGCLIATTWIGGSDAGAVGLSEDAGHRGRGSRVSAAGRAGAGESRSGRLRVPRVPRCHGARVPWCQACQGANVPA